MTVFGAGLLVGTALTVIIPEGIRSLYEVDEHIPGEATTEHKHVEHSSTIGLSLVLGFVFMMLVDQVASRRREGPQEKNMTATIGLVVHAGTYFR